jgi:hypothetical protein
MNNHFGRSENAVATAALLINASLDNIKEAFVEIEMDCGLNGVSADI